MLAGFIMAPSASAAGYGCPGSQIDTYAVKTSGGTTYSNIYLYYDSATGTNCASNVRTSAGGYGTSNPQAIDVQIWRCVAGSTPGAACTADTPIDGDYGYYQYYAGPVDVTASNRCITIFAQTRHNDVWAKRTLNAVHCG
ncbi:hypothetical protein TN53_02115 [Streptomyces sp. WM6386]|nr:hypothetical protein TN53_02115 [Streptomyces sp. WM6386]